MPAALRNVTELSGVPEVSVIGSSRVIGQLQRDFALIGVYDDVIRRCRCLQRCSPLRT